MGEVVAVIQALDEVVAAVQAFDDAFIDYDTLCNLFGLNDYSHADIGRSRL